MARGRRRGPFLLRFRALLVSLNLHAAKVVDTRQASKVRYSLQDCYVCAFALFVLQDPSVLEFQRRFQDQLRTNNLNATFGVAPRRSLSHHHGRLPVLQLVPGER